MKGSGKIVRSARSSTFYKRVFGAELGRDGLVLDVGAGDARAMEDPSRLVRLDAIS